MNELKLKFKQYWYTRSMGSGFGTFAKSSGLSKDDSLYNSYCNYTPPFLSLKDRAVESFPSQNIFIVNKQNELVIGKSVYLGSTQQSSGRQGLFFYHAFVTDSTFNFFPASLFLNQKIFKTSIDLSAEEKYFGSDLPEIEISTDDYIFCIKELVNDEIIEQLTLIGRVLSLILKEENLNRHYQIFIKADNPETVRKIILLSNLLFPPVLSQKLPFITYYFPLQELLFSNIRLIGVTPETESTIIRQKTGNGIYFIETESSINIKPQEPLKTSSIYINTVLRYLRNKELDTLQIFISFFSKIEVNKFNDLDILTEAFLLLTETKKIDLPDYLEMIAHEKATIFRQAIWKKLYYDLYNQFREFTVEEMIRNEDGFNRSLFSELLSFCEEIQNNDLQFYVNLFDRISSVFAEKFTLNDFKYIDHIPVDFRKEVTGTVLLNLQEKNSNLLINYFLLEYERSGNVNSLIKLLSSQEFNETTLNHLFKTVAESKLKVEEKTSFLSKGLDAKLIPAEVLGILQETVRPGIYKYLLVNVQKIFQESWPFPDQNDEIKKLNKEKLEVISHHFKKVTQETLRKYGYSIDDEFPGLISFLEKHLSYPLEFKFFIHVFNFSHSFNWSDYLFKYPEIIYQNYTLLLKEFQLSNDRLCKIILDNDKRTLVKFFIKYSEKLPEHIQSDFLKEIDSIILTQEVTLKDEPLRLINVFFDNNDINPIDYLFLCQELISRSKNFNSIILSRVDLPSLNQELGVLLKVLFEELQNTEVNKKRIKVLLSFYQILYKDKSPLPPPGKWVSTNLSKVFKTLDRAILKKNQELLLFIIESGNKVDDGNFLIPFLENLEHRRWVSRIIKRHNSFKTEKGVFSNFSKFSSKLNSLEIKKTEGRLSKIGLNEKSILDYWKLLKEQDFEDLLKEKYKYTWKTIIIHLEESISKN